MESPVRSQGGREVQAVEAIEVADTGKIAVGAEEEAVMAKVDVRGVRLAELSGGMSITSKN